MEESARKDQESMEFMQLNDRIGDIRKHRTLSEISVEGYGTSLQKYALKLALTKHFASCGTILAVSVIKSVALIRFDGEDAKDNALELSGTEVGGCNVIVKAAPWQSEPYDRSAARKKSSRMWVTGYDTCLDEIDIQIALCEYFSSCGEVTQVGVHPSEAVITIVGRKCVDKAMELCRRNVGGMNLVVEPDKAQPDNNGKRYWEGDGPRRTGIVSESRLLELAKMRKMEKKEKKMKK
ncbi:Nucleolin 2 [Cardamine amara subsp. amara]|uniref:Nucleolin 2 n=1 Tax=Cardamine amara subsp. amara TaxID=228776 RepID=A0ABD0ZVQ2_CARAN